MRDRQAKLPDALARLFLDVTGDVPDDASLLRMRRISGALNLRDNDALWSVMALLECYARLYEAMPERIRQVGEGGFDAVRREAEAATDTLMRQHRDALARCKETIQLAEEMTREHEARYRAALAALNDQSLTVLAERAADRIARMAGNRLVGVLTVAVREQRARLDETVAQIAVAGQMATQGTVRALRRLFWSALVVLSLVTGAGACAGWWRGVHTAQAGYVARQRTDGAPPRERGNGGDGRSIDPGLAPLPGRGMLGLCGVPCGGVPAYGGRSREGPCGVWAVVPGIGRIT